MDEWQIQQQQHRMISGGVGPIHSYHPARSRSSPYSIPHQMSELKQSYQYQQNPSTTSSNPLSPSTSTTTSNPSTAPLSVKNDSNDTTSSLTDEVSTTTSNSDVYTPNNTNVSYTPMQMEQIQHQHQQQQQHQQRMLASKSSIGPMTSYHPGQQQIMSARTRAMPYPMPPPSSHHQQQHHHPSMYPHPSGQVCQCAQHMQSNNSHYPMHPSQHPMYYQQQQQQQQQEAWYRYQQQQQQAAWRQHQMQQQQQHLQSHPQPIPIEQTYNAILSETTSTTKLKATKTKSKKKQSNMTSFNDEPIMKYQPIPPSSLNLALQQQQQRIPPQSASYYPAIYSTPGSYGPPQQLPPPPSISSSIPQEHPLYAQTSPSTLSHHQSQIFTSPLSNPSTPHQLHNNGEYNGTAEFGVPYHHGAPGSVSSLTDALCPGNNDTTDRQMTPGPPSVGTPRVAAHQYSFPHTPLTPQTINNQNTNPHTPVMMPPTPNPLSAPPTPLTRPRSSSEQTQSITNQFQQYEQNKPMNNVDDLAAYLKDPTNIYLTDDVSSTLFDDIDALADTYLGQQSNNNHQQQTNDDNNSAEDILLSFLCSDNTN
ncbi:unnamed protein product [Adineta steineri]|uniref:Uncharacterized protein n=1 Tax=Adineta steineri TaxID=433720 RepID=A0A815M663_9BILA|nr:unnamed protein product [Adineta steineri]CAF1620686.1 unnamed protein product [Adineta steineri]